MTDSVPTSSGTTPKLRRLEERRPGRPGEEVDRADLGEELERREEQRDDDPERRHDRDECAERRAEAGSPSRRGACASSGARSGPRRRDGSARRGGHQLLAASTRLSKSAFACASCSSFSGTNPTFSAIAVSLSRTYPMKSSTAGSAKERLLDVDVERPRERLVGAVLRGLDARCDAAVAAVDLDRVQRVRVRLVVGEPEIPEPSLLAADALHDHVVVLARGVVRPARALRHR